MLPRTSSNNFGPNLLQESNFVITWLIAIIINGLFGFINHFHKQENLFHLKIFKKALWSPMVNLKINLMIKL